MKKFCVLAFLMMTISAVNAQHYINSFFDDKGSARIQTVEYSAARDTIVTTFHRQDDIVWARYVYRIVDMRYKQNFPLYFPTRYDDPDYRSLFKVIVDAIVDGMPVYQKGMDQLKPDFSEPMDRSLLPSVFLADDPAEDFSDDPTHYDISSSDAMLLHYDSINDELSFHFYPYEGFVRNQLKYLIQEVVFFDRHTSRLHTKIIAIAPMQSDKIMTRDNSNILGSVLESMLFWIAWDELRPYMAMQYTIPSQNETKRLTFDEFFQKHLYTSYVLGEGNMYNRMITEYSADEEAIKREQKRIETELLNFEQDLWEY